MSMIAAERGWVAVLREVGGAEVRAPVIGWISVASWADKADVQPVFVYAGLPTVKGQLGAVELMGVEFEDPFKLECVVEE